MNFFVAHVIVTSDLLLSSSSFAVRNEPKENATSSQKVIKNAVMLWKTSLKGSPGLSENSRASARRSRESGRLIYNLCDNFNHCCFWEGYVLRTC